MIKHVVMWKLKETAEGNSKTKNAQKMKEVLDSLVDKINEINSFEVGLNISKSERAYDIVLYSEFKNEDDLEKYQKHPEHQKVVNFVKKIVSSATAVDYLT